VIHAFPSESKTDGAYPFSSLTYSGGVLYGTTNDGGQHNAGAVYRLLPPSTEGGTWKEGLISSFGHTNGQWPQAAVLRDANTGNIYGTTAGGGASNYWGAVYELTPPVSGNHWTETVIYSFTGQSDGGFPRSSLISDGKGNLYGSTDQGGKGGGGVVYELSPPAQSSDPWTETVIHGFTFGGADGSGPSNLIFDSLGALYGATQSGGDATCNAGCGTVFKLTPPAKQGGAWTESVLYSFHATDGLSPEGGLIFDGSGALYGTANDGGQGQTRNYCCGTVFQLTPPAGDGVPWTLTTLYAFSGGSDGGYPTGGVIFDSTGTLYGTTTGGGSLPCGPEHNGCGVVFALNPPSTQGGAWTEQVLHAFVGGDDGEDPLAGLLLVGNNLYGTTGYGGPADTGIVFEITP
jgi:uncharacterized repeat protein (TIGR03803 family)